MPAASCNIQVGPSSSTEALERTTCKPLLQPEISCLLNMPPFKFADQSARINPPTSSKSARPNPPPTFAQSVSLAKKISEKPATASVTEQPVLTKAASVQTHFSAKPISGTQQSVVIQTQSLPGDASDKSSSTLVAERSNKFPLAVSQPIPAQPAPPTLLSHKVTPINSGRVISPQLGSVRSTAPLAISGSSQQHKQLPQLTTSLVSSESTQFCSVTRLPSCPPKMVIKAVSKVQIPWECKLV